MNEQVLVTPRAALESVGGGELFIGFQPHFQKYLQTLFTPGYTAYLDRALVETIPALKQIIPYVVLSTQDRKVIAYQRGSKSGEKRLVGRKSVGLGGHMSLRDGMGTDLELQDIYVHARRELREELKEFSVLSLSVVGLVNEETTEVDKVHLGVLLHGVVDRVPESNEKGKIVGVEALTAMELIGQFDNLERWSQLVVANLPLIRGV